MLTATFPRVALLLMSGLLLVSSGCRSPYRSDQGALLGGLGGAGIGAIIGKQLGNTAGGAVIGGMTGLIAGSVIGSELDEIEARNRAQIEAKLGRQVAAGAVTTQDVVAMTQAGVDQDLIVNHVRAHGVATPVTTDDVIALHNQGVSKPVIKAMQAPPRRQVVPVSQPTVIHHYDSPYYSPYYHPYHHSYYDHHPRHHHRHHDPHRVSWGISVGH